MYQTPDPEGPFHPLQPFREIERRTHPWSAVDLFVFAFFFLATVVFFPLSALAVMRIFRPDVSVQDLTVVEQVVLQGVMDVVLVAFIMFLVKVVRHRGFLETI